MLQHAPLPPELPRALHAEIDKQRARGAGLDDIAARAMRTTKDFLANYYAHRQELRLVQ